MSEQWLCKKGCKSHRMADIPGNGQDGIYYAVAQNADVYKLVLSLRDAKNYAWSGEEDAVVEIVWTISPYEFCSIEDFQEMKTDADYYFLIKVKGQFRKESGPGIEFLSLLKGGPEAEKGLDKMLELITFPYAAVDSPSGRETVFLPLMLNIVQQHVLSSIATDIVAYSPLIAYSNNIGKIKGKQVIMAEEDLSADVLQLEDDYLKAPIVVTDMDTADEYVAGNVADAVVSYTVCPEDPQPGAFCYKMLVNAEVGELYYFRKHRITRKTGPGFLVEDMNRIVEALD